MIFIYLFHIISTFIFYIKESDIIKNKIRDIVFAIKNYHLIKSNKNNPNNEINNNKKINIKTDNNNNKNILTNNNKNFMTDNNLRKNKTKMKNNNIQKNNNIKNIQTDNNKINFFNINNNQVNKRKIKSKFKRKSQYEIIGANSNINKGSRNSVKSLFLLGSNNLNENNNNNGLIPFNNTQRGNKKNIVNEIKRKEIINKTKKIMEYIDDELNDLNYESAVVNDKRPFSVYYMSLLKTKHPLIFSFFYNKDYNSRIVKIDLLFVSFTMNYTVNALFFDDDTMHQIYESKGKFELEYQLPKSIYSSLISMVLDLLLKLLAISNDSIIKFKQNKKIDDVDERGKNLKNTLKIKFILYYIISFIFLLFFWYYISMFGAIYKNT